MSYPYNTKNLLRKKLKALKLKGNKCQKCGYNKYYGALEFHHRDPSQKEFVWTTMRNKKWSTIIRELKKCDLLCSNCHKETHSDPNLLQEYLEWNDEIEQSRISSRVCCYCGSTFKPYQNKMKFCTEKCFRKSCEKIAWPANLSELVKNSSKRAVALQLGVSDKAVAKRLNNHNSS